MLSKQRCPHTGIVNYFSAKDPFISIGSIIEAGAPQGPRAGQDQDQQPGGYHWRYYDAVQTVSGIATDMAEAEQRLKSQYRARSLQHA